MVQHAGMGDRAGDVVMSQARIELHRIGKGIGLGRRSAGKPSAARGDLIGFFLRHGTLVPCRETAQKSRRLGKRVMLDTQGTTR